MPQGYDIYGREWTGSHMPQEPEIIFDWGQARNLAYVQKLNRQVADKLFPHRTPQIMFLKMYSEIAEIVRDPNDPQEIADVLIMLLDRMDQLGCDAGTEIMLKLEKNMHRKWAIDPSTGVAQHIKE